MRALSFSKIRITDPFWSQWQKTIVESTLPAIYRQLEETPRLANFRRAAGLEEGSFEGQFWFDDSDVYKYLEAAAYGLAIHKNPVVRKQVDDTIKLVLAAQMPDGYLNTFFQLKHPTLKYRNLHTMHEMYCGGHFIEAAVAFTESLGEKKLLEGAIKYANHLLETFGPNKRRGYCGHEEIELALIRLADVTKDSRYRALAHWMVEERGKSPSPWIVELSDDEAHALSPWAKGMLMPEGKYHGEYAQDHAPIREHNKVVGHAVRAMYLYIAAADYASDLEDEPLDTALESTWSNLVTRRMYLTGGIGPSSKNEGFTEDFDLPNLTAYAETCAACGLVFWGQAMLHATANSEYADVMERALYNGALAGISISGDQFFYDNPLESRGTHQRTPWFGCACCPPNIARLIGSLGKYVAGVNESAFYLHMPVGLVANTVMNGIATKIEVKSNYPWSGEIEIVVTPDRAVEFELLVRIPEWADDVSTDLVDSDDEADYATGYVRFARTWKPGDVVKVDFAIAPKWVEADPRVRDNLGRTALTYGPLIYAAEEHDLGFAPQLLSVDPELEIEVTDSPVLGGIKMLTTEAIAEREEFVDGLYAEVGTTEVREVDAKFIPYYAWNNRGPNSMQVWIRKG
jgi:DUF1680 family protein